MIQQNFINQAAQLSKQDNDISSWTVLHPIELLSGYMPVFVAALLITLILTPIVRRVAIGRAPEVAAVAVFVQIKIVIF